MNPAKSSELVLALRPFRHGLAFVFLESPLSPVDWGIKEVRGGKWIARCAAQSRALTERFHPTVLVLPAQLPRSGARAARLLTLIGNHATGAAIEVRRYSQAEIQACFKDAGAVTRYEIAQAIAAQVHAFGPQLPRLRKAWANEDERMYLFDAAALAMAHYASAPPAEAEPEEEDVADGLE
jgi:hypothetical protein